MAPPKKNAPVDSHNLFPEPADCFHLRIPQHFLDLCEGDLLEALVLSKLCYWATFEYKDRLRRGKAAPPEEIVVRRSLTQLAGDCLGALHADSVKHKIRSLERRGFLSSERKASPHSNREQIVARVINVKLLQEQLEAWTNLDSPVRRSRFFHGSLEMKVDGIWIPFGRRIEGPAGGDPMKLQGVPHETSWGLSKGEVKENTPKGGKDSQRTPLGGEKNENIPGVELSQDSRWIIEGVDFSPGGHFHGNCLDQCQPSDLLQILNLLRLSQEFGYGITIPASGKRAPEPFLNASRILREYEQRSWSPDFTPAFASAWGVPETIGGPRGWEAVSADLRAAFTYDLAQKAGENRNPGPLLRFLESQVGDAGVASQFWVSLVKVKRFQAPVGPSAVLREQAGQEAMIRLSDRFQAAPDRPRDPRVFWERCLAIHEKLKTHRPGIKVHAALVGGWFRSRPVDVPSILSLYDTFLIESGTRDPGDPGTGWPPVADDWESFVDWGRAREPADSFDLEFQGHQSEQEALEERKDRDAAQCFDRWRDDPAFYVSDEVALGVVQDTGLPVKSLSAPMLVHVVRLIQARKACISKPCGTHLRALASEALREPSPKVAAVEEAPWAVLGVQFLDSVRAYWEEHFPDKMDIPEASLFPISGS